MARGRSQRSKDLIAAAYRILAEIQPASVRAACYRLFAEQLIADMSKGETNRVSRQLTWAREQGEIPWAWIVDETRHAERIASWADPDDYADAVIASYRRDYWGQQPCHVEVWSEKGTVRGTLAPVLDEYAVTFRVMHGYASATAVQQIVTEAARGPDRPWIVLYVGDWDPSGLHMSKVDLPKRLVRYTSTTPLGASVSIDLRRLALEKRDCTQRLPSFAAATKKNDPRWYWFTTHYGRTCWELDALDPRVLRQRVETAILKEIDAEAWARCVQVEAAESKSLRTIMTTFRTVTAAK